MYIKGPETRQTPPEFQERLTQKFGTNQFGDPHFKIEWGQSIFIRMGNLWRDKQGNERIGYRDRYQSYGPCWVIMRWKAPIEYGSPRSYYVNTFDSLTHTYHTGEYPWRGRYEPVQPLMHKELDAKNNLVISHFPLSHYLIDTVIPLILAFEALSVEQKNAARQAAKEAKDREETEQVAEMMYSNLPSFYGPVSYSGQGCRTSLLDRKMDAIQRVWNRMSKDGTRPQFTKGFAQGDAPLRRK